MSQIFNRRWKVTVGDSESLSTADLRVVFRVKKTLEKDPNTASVKISNLAEGSRAKLNKKGMHLVLQAGYEGNVGTIFSGDTRTVDHTRESADWQTHIQCGDGESAYQFARIEESFAANTSTGDIIKKVATALGIGFGNLNDVLSKPLAVSTFKHGFTAFGPASQVLDKLILAAGYRWSIQQGALQITKAGEPVQTNAFLLSADSGLLGSPDHTAPDKKGKPAILKVKALLNPNFIPGYIVRIESRAVKGEFLMQSVEHSGDSHGAEWVSNLECVARKL